MTNLIVSIQGYSKFVSMELANKAFRSGSCFIRTDQDICKKDRTIGLKKNKEKFYITTKIKDIDEISKWAKYIAIDCRKGNRNLKAILKHCQKNNYKIIADIECLADVKNILKLGYSLEWVSTTFCYDKLNKLEILKEIIDYVKKYNITVIAEGGYNERFEINYALNIGADYICIGSAISDIIKLTTKYLNYMSVGKIKKQTLLIDIDDTLLLYSEKTFRYLNAKPNIEEIQKLNKLYKKGYEIILFTSRDYSKYNYTEKQMLSFGIKYHKLIMNKPLGIYIDKDSKKSLKEIEANE